MIRLVRPLYGRTAVSDFGPLSLKAVRQKMIEVGWCRTNINRQMGRIKHIFKWGTENEPVPPMIYSRIAGRRGIESGSIGGSRI